MLLTCTVLAASLGWAAHLFLGLFGACCSPFLELHLVFSHLQVSAVRHVWGSLPAAVLLRTLRTFLTNVACVLW